MSGFFGFLAFAAFVAFIVGMVKPGIMVFWGKKKTRGAACLYLVAMLVFGIIASSASGNAPTAVTAAQPSASSTIVSSTAVISQAAESVAPVVPVSSAVALKPYSATLVSGYYTAGVDFPAGIYTITAVKGNGNVITDDGSLNAIMGTGENAVYEKEYKNAEFKDGTILTISGATVKITSKAGVDTSTIGKRVNTATKPYTLSSGNYIAGDDIEAGTYDLSIVKGAGNVQTEDGSLNAIMGTGSNDMYQQKYMNVNLEKDAKLVISGCTIKLTPSK